MGSTTKEERAAISEYFDNPSMAAGTSATPAPSAVQGPGGAEVDDRVDEATDDGEEHHVQPQVTGRVDDQPKKGGDNGNHAHGGNHAAPS